MGDIKNLPGIQSSGVGHNKVLLRVDLNVPMLGSEVSDSTRIERIIPTVRYLIESGAKIILISHLGRPKGPEEGLSLRPIAGVVSKVLKTGVTFVPGISSKQVHTVLDSLPWGSVVLLENLRFYSGETSNDPEFAQQLAELADIYVNDAFSCSHRKHASIDGVARCLPSFAGFNLQEELQHIGSLVSERPVAAVVGGAKASTKIRMLSNLASKVDFLILGGGLSNTFLHVSGFKVGSSICEHNHDETLSVLEVAKQSGCKIILPTDHVVAQSPDGLAVMKENCSVEDEDIIFDIGNKTSILIGETLSKCSTVFWNGPMGMFENKNFSRGTEDLIRDIVDCHKSRKAKTIAGGGDSIFALKSLGYHEQDFTYVSTGGGALLHFLSDQSSS
ncbi:phosphoglycerate kinase [Candidatus Anaplasma sp. TIGMIC]|uniref:phosphoglycerate kinase n=1 Tax=Candidatus Anaplasma sp. TIGMIC TaxID=3020713 RepID=UPI0023306769|nr:phosphoglycerate kinase [Candidatus Anaplasma sp. TIGMIC]MDB1135489.1 phosphoglycerate kinase [Candidatus Anaplasma sp. TIGMIC]